MMFLRSCLWVWLILYLLINEYRVLYCISIVACVLHHMYFKYSKSYIVILVSLLFFTVLRIESRPYRLIMDTSVSYKGYVVSVEEYGAIIALDNYRKIVAYDVEADLGDQIIVNGSLEEIDSLHNLGLFDYKQYMNQRGIYQYIQIKEYEIVRKSYSLSAVIYRFIQSKSIRSLANQFLYGYGENSNLDVFFSSGMHFSFLLYHIIKICSFFMNENKSKWVELGVSALMLACFPNEISLFRIFVFRLLKWSEWRGVAKLSIGMMFLLFLRPEYCSSLSFIIPFALSLSSYFLKKLPRFISSKLVLFPIQLAIQYEINILWLVFFDLFKLLFSIDFIVMLLALLFPFELLSMFSNFLHSIIVTGYELISCVDVGLVVGKASLIVCILYLMGLFLLQESKRGGRLIFCSVILFFLPIYCNPFIKVTFLDVGQGDCMVVEYPFHQGIVMVDTGGGNRDSLASQVLIPYIKSRGFNSLDLLIISHHDEDHDGAMKDLLDEIKVDYYIDYETMPKGIKLNQYDIQFLDILRHGVDENNLSLITLFDFKTFKLLTAGDLSKENEEQLLREYPDLEVDFLKLSHHGSSTSSSLYYLSRLNPDIVFNSSGRNNLYHHPSNDVLKILDRLDIPLYDTQKRGSIHLYIFKSISFILSAKEG